MPARTVAFSDKATRQSVLIVLTLVLAMLGTFPHDAVAQIRASLAGIGGVSSSSADVGGLVGGKATFGLSPRLGVETSVVYSGEGRGTSALTAQGRLLVSLLPAERRARPFAAAGLGVYRARFNVGRMSPFGDVLADGHMMYGIMDRTDLQSLLGSMPAFYSRRMGSIADLDGMMRSGRRATFTDPALSVGTGVALNVARHVVLSPEATLLVVMRSGRSRTIGMFSLGAGYRW